jgi:hypothetical protein
MTLIPLAAIVVLLGSGSLRAAAVPVLNPSFESPTVPGGFPAYPVIDSWQKTPEVPGAPLLNGLTWNDEAGVFPNSPSPLPDHIDNMDGNQAAYLFATPGVGFFQDLSVTYTVGLSYNLTLGVIGGGGGMTPGSTLLLEMYYRDAGNNMVTIGGAPITYTILGFPNTTHFLDYTLNLPMVQAGDAWAGRNIGLEVVASTGTGAGYWDVDNLRIQAVPEPSSLAFAALGVGSWIALRVHRRRRA